MKTTHPRASQLAATIMREKPRLWEYLLATQVLADEFEEYARLDALRIRQPIVFSFLNDTAQLQDYLGLIKKRLSKLLWFFKEFFDRFIEPIKIAKGLGDAPGDAEEIVAVCINAAKIYGELLAFRTEIDDERRVYSADFPPLVQSMFEEIFTEISQYIIVECDVLRTHFQKYGPIAHRILHMGSRSLTDGGDGGEYKMALSHDHKFSQFDITKIDSLAMLIEHMTPGESLECGTSGFVYLLIC